VIGGSLASEVTTEGLLLRGAPSARRRVAVGVEVRA